MTTAAKKATKKPTKRKPKAKPNWADEGNNKVIKPEAYAKIVKWLELPDDDGRKAQLHLLVHDVPCGPFISAKYHPSKPDRIAVKVKDKHWNSPRLFDPPAFALMRLLTAFDGTVRMSKRQAEDPAKIEGPDRWYPAINLSKPTNFILSRIIWGVTTYNGMEQVKPDKPSTSKRDSDTLAETFYDLRLTNLKSETNSKPAVRTRADAIMGALVFRYNLQIVMKDKNADGKPNPLPIADDYLKAILKCFELLDELKAKVLMQREEGKLPLGSQAMSLSENVR